MTHFNARAKRRTMLLVDDEPHVLSALSRAIRARYRDAPMSVEIFERPADAIERARAKRFDIVISDMRMPDMDGATFLQVFREIQPNVPRVLLSARADVEQLSRAVNHGRICRFCEKPWVDKDLLDLVEKEIEEAEILAEHRAIVSRRRIEAGQMSEAQEAMRILMEEHPLLAEVQMASDGSVLLQSFPD